jgi:hypothetical protein
LQRWRVVAVAAVSVALVLGACNADSGDDTDAGLAADVRAAVAAVEAERGAGQEFFEVTATPPLTNVFVAVEDATAVVAYVYRDGELEEPAPVQSGASGFTFTAEAIAFDDDAVLSKIADELPDAMIQSLSVEGGANDTVRYVVSVLSDAGGVLDITVGADGTVVSVDPV